MSRDIRSWLVSKNPAKPAAIDDDDDVIPESPNVQIKNKKKESKKKRRISDSDDEIFESKKKKSDHPSPKKQKKKTPDKPAFKEVKLVDVFGTGPIKRSERLSKNAKKNTEIGIHSDEEFEKSLLEVDALEELATKCIKEEKIHKSPTKNLNKTIEEKDEKNKNVTKQKTPRKSYDNPETKRVTRSASKLAEEKQDISPIKKERSRVVTTLFSDKKDKNEVKKRKDKKSLSDKDLKIAENEIDISKDTKQEGTLKDKKRDFTEFAEGDVSVIEDNDDGNRKKKKVDKSLNDDKKDKKEVKKEKDKSVSQDLKIIENEKDIIDKKQEGTLKDKKKDFREFVESDVSVIEDYDNANFKRKKLDKSLNDSVLTDEERHERKMHSAALYQKYLNRSGPKHLGAKELPEGSSNCLANCAFLLTGVLDSFEREEIAAAIVKYGGCTKNSISKKVTHLLAGDDAGPAKMAKAQELGIKIINEDEFIQMIIDLSKKQNKLDITKESKNVKSPSKKTPKRTTKDKDTSEKKESKDKDERDKRAKDRERKTSSDKLHVKSESRNRDRKNSRDSKSKTPQKHQEKTVEIKNEIKSETQSNSSSSIKLEVSDITSKSSSEISTSSMTANSMMWVEKYKPQSIKYIIGQHGDASNVKKLMNWLTKWYENRKAKLPKPSPWAKNYDGGYYKAALLSGPPGVGKTTSVALVCKELGFDTVEFNASDTRNKTLIKERIGDMLTTTSLSAFSKGSTGKQAVTKKHVLVMDEVDGMAGNEDRGGMQELISLIKSTSVPIICMCNDRNSQKMRSLVNYCYDLRFNRPRVEQIKSAMLSICCKEGIKIPPDALSQLIVAANQDVRQTLNLLSMWAIDPSLMDSDRLKKDAQSGKKDIKLGPWEAVRKVFSAEDHKNMSINDKSDLFFYDYSLAPLFVHENYLHVAPHCPKNEILARLAKAADSISLGDLVDARIRGNQAWNLLPIQAMYSSVIPGHLLSGHVAGQINFPGWLGNNSRTNKMNRLCQEIHAHTRLSTSGSKSSIFLDYSTHLRDAIITPLLKEKSDGIEKSLEVLESYNLLREDLDSLIELSLWSGQRNPMILIDSKIKAAMTRSYNKKALALPYAPGAVKKGRLTEDGEEGENEEEEQNSDPENDALIKKKKTKDEKPSKDKASSSQDKASSSKERSGTSKDKPSSSKKKK